MEYTDIDLRDMRPIFKNLKGAIREVDVPMALSLIDQTPNEELITHLLHDAIFYKNPIGVCKALLDKMTKENIHGLNSYENNALHIAVDRGDIEICKLLLEKMDSDVVNQLNFHIRPPLFYAAYNGNLAICKLLLPLMDNKIINVFDDRGFYSEGKSCLMWAAEEGHKEVCKLLVEYMQ